MSRLAIKYELITPRRTITFNGFENDAVNGFSGDYYRLTDVQGLDFSTLRTGVQQRSQADGDLLLDSWRASRYVGLNGVLVAQAIANRYTLEENLRDALNSIVRANGTLRWFPPSLPTKIATVRLWEPLQVGGDPILRSWMFQLVAPDPLIYNDTQTTTTSLTPTTAFNVTNAGNAAMFPLVRVYGNATATTAFTLNNVTAGVSIAVSALGTDLNTTAKYLEFDMANRTVVTSGAVNRISKVDAANSVFWSLLAGVNSIQITGVSGGNPSKVEVVFRDAWIGG